MDGCKEQLEKPEVCGCVAGEEGHAARLLAVGGVMSSLT